MFPVLPILGPLILAPISPPEFSLVKAQMNRYGGYIHRL